MDKKIVVINVKIFESYYEIIKIITLPLKINISHHNCEGYIINVKLISVKVIVP